MFGLNILILICIFRLHFLFSFTCQTFDRARCLFETSFFLLRAGLTFSCGRCLVPEFGEFLLDSRGGGGRESKVILTFVSSSAMIILVDKDDHLENYDKYHQRRDLVELTTQQERFVDQEKKVIVINVTMLVLSVFSVHPRRDKNDVDDDDSVVWGGEPGN